MSNWFLGMLCALLVPGAGDPDGVGDASPPPAETLVVLHQGGAGPVEAAFLDERLDRVRALAGELDVAFRAVDVSAGAPPLVTSTPMIVFQNHRGRAVYQGRLTTLERLRSFVLTARHVPQRQTGLRREGVVVWSGGRTDIAGKLKITDLDGDAPDDLDRDAFAKAVREGVVAGMRRFRWRDAVELDRGDRTFYLDVHPHRAGDGTLYLSYAVYSQFHCTEPIVSGLEQPLTGPWDERARLLGELGATLEKALFAELSSPRTGDGLRAVSGRVPDVSWESLGLSLPPEPEGATAVAVDPSAPLPRRWIVEDAEAPPVVFHFQEPLDYYNGVCRRMGGELALDEQGGLGGAAGFMEVSIDSISMGDPDLDQSLLGSDILDAETQPRSRLTVRAFAGDGGRLVLGELRAVELAADFGLRGRTVPVKVRLTLQPVLAADGSPRILVEGGFTLRLQEPFGILGPDGPAPAKDTVILQVGFRLRPAES